MPIGDIWRVATSGIVSGQAGPPPVFSSHWVTIWHLEVVGGVGTDNREGREANAFAINKLVQSSFDGLFGSGVHLESTQAVRMSDSHTVTTNLPFDLGDAGQDCLPSQCCVAVTGRGDDLGRRSTRYAPGIGNENLGEFGELKLTPAVLAIAQWFESAGIEDFTYRTVIFDESEVLPTVVINRAIVSPGFRTQRRRVLSVSGEQSTAYQPIT